MGNIGAHCMKGCEGGKNEIGEENLENIIIDQNKNLKINDSLNENLKAKSSINTQYSKMIENKRVTYL